MAECDQVNMADLTRFDFHVVRFVNSESVERMSAAEIGQYILLLCKSWLSNKEASLPDDLDYMAKAAKVQEVSELVASMFPITDTPWGMRRRNETLYGEWLMALDRSESARERGAKRWDAVRNADSNAVSIPNGIALSRERLMPNHTNQSYQSNHTNQNTNLESTTGSFSQGNYSNIRTHWYRHFKKNLSTSKRNKEQYAVACSTYNEDCVLEYLETWAADNVWVAAHPKGDNRLYVFLAALSAMVAGDQMRQVSETKVVAAKKSDEDVWAATRTADDAERKKENEEWESKQKEEQILIELGKGGL